MITAQHWRTRLWTFGDYDLGTSAETPPERIFFFVIYVTKYLNPFLFGDFCYLSKMLCKIYFLHCYFSLRM